MARQSLNGSWSAWTDIKLADKFYSPEFAAPVEHCLTVPGSWQTHPGLEQHSGSMLYRTSFDWQPEEGMVYRLQFSRSFYLTTVWLNGKRLGQHEGYFQQFGWEVDKELHPGENVVAVRVDAPPPGKSWRDTITGVFGEWDCKPDVVNPGGIWGDVSLISTRRGFIGPVQVDNRLTAWNSAQVTVRTRLTWQGQRTVLGAEISMVPRNFNGKSHAGQQTMEVQPGENDLELRLTVPEPKLWWTWDQGYPSLYDLTFTLRDQAGMEIESYKTHLGIRTVEWKDWKFYLNGRRQFLRGASYGPPSFFPATVDVERLSEDVNLAVTANLNCLRVYGHVARPEFYRICAEKGVLLWQDFPLDKRYDHEITATALRQVRDMVVHLRNETAICFWCCHNEPHALPSSVGKRRRPAQLRMLNTTARSSRPTWNKDVLDPRLRAAVQLEDQSRPVFAHSGVFGFLRGGSATHHYWGWNTPDYRSLLWLRRLFPRTLRLVTEYGSQSWPLDHELLKNLGEDSWPDLDWALVERDYLLDKQQLDSHVRPEDYDNLYEYALATQSYQAELLQFYHETLRKAKYSPCGGAMLFYLVDASPLISWSLLDYRRQPKLAYEVTKRAMCPVQVMVDWPKAEFHPGEVWQSSIYVVNDLHRPLIALGLTWQLLDSVGTVVVRERRIADAEPDAVTKVAILNILVPETLGDYRLELQLETAGKEKIQNYYHLKVCE